MHWIAVLVLFAVTVGYLFIGAAVFRKLESDNEAETKNASRTHIKQFLLNASCVDPEKFEEMLQLVLKAYEDGVFVTSSTESADNWSFWNAFFFSATVVTTIGYGNISPSTFGGQLFCIFYAVIGIPLVGVFLAGLGNILSTPVKKFKKSSKNKFIRVLKSVIIALSGFAILICLPAIGFHFRENWTYFESIYYGIITLLTIGFGDYVVGQTDKTYSGWYKVLTIVWIFVGLAWFAIVISDIGDYYKKKVENRENAIRRRKSQEFDAIRHTKSRRQHSNSNEQNNGAFSSV